MVNEALRIFKEAGDYTDAMAYPALDTKQLTEFVAKARGRISAQEETK
jgi:hypothetical protein